ncbi:hypothetical protein NL487_26625, partial [Klebsiella pneumoniae]|nr:hypothetical protein [Klebsiella pneumoniae]
LLGRLRSPYPPDIDETIAFLADVLDDPDAAFVFVIDDVHHLTDPDLIEVLRQLVHTSPPAVRFILASRRELPLQVGRLRVLGEVTELRID